MIFVAACVMNLLSMGRSSLSLSGIGTAVETAVSNDGGQWPDRLGYTLLAATVGSMVRTRPVFRRSQKYDALLTLLSSFRELEMRPAVEIHPFSSR